MTQPTKREQLAAMRLEDFKEHLRIIAGEASEQITGAARPNPLLGTPMSKLSRMVKFLQTVGFRDRGCGNNCFALQRVTSFARCPAHAGSISMRVRTREHT